MASETLVRPKRFTVGEFDQMVRAGVFRAEDRLELIAGEIVEMSPIGSRHAACVDRLTQLISRAIGETAILRVQGPIRVEEHSQLYPDVAVLKARADFYSAEHPGPEDVWLLIEVADTSLEYDRDVKLPLYASAGIPEVWLIDLAGRCLWVFRQPAGGSYREKKRVGPEETVACLGLPSVSIAVRDVLT